MTARDQILGGIRRSLGRGPLTGDAAAAVQQRLSAHAANLIPARTENLDTEELVGVFRTWAEAADMSIDRVADAAAVPRAVTRYLARHNLPAEAAVSPDPSLDAYPWNEQPLLKLRKGRAEAADAVSITPAFAAIAETGTLVLTSGAERPTTLNLLPGTHIVVLRKDQVVGASEAVWAKLRATTSERGEAMPRTVNFISGPSRTGDIESILQLGAHGPVRLHVIIVES